MLKYVHTGDCVLWDFTQPQQMNFLHLANEEITNKVSNSEL